MEAWSAESLSCAYTANRPLEGAPAFDGVGAGWCVYPPGSAHRPTVTGGSAHVLYLLPEGETAFTGE